MWDGTPWREVHTAIFGPKPSLPQGCVSLEEFQDQFFALEYRMAKQYAIKRLSRQSMLSQALARAMRQRLVSEGTVEGLIQELCSSGIINDQDWVSGFIRRQSERKVGPKAIAQKLMGKGVHVEIDSDVEKQKEMVVQLLATRYSRRNLSDFRERQKVIASLLRRGFEWEVVLSCLKPNLSP